MLFARACPLKCRTQFVGTRRFSFSSDFEHDSDCGEGGRHLRSKYVRVASGPGGGQVSLIPARQVKGHFTSRFRCAGHLVKEAAQSPQLIRFESFEMNLRSGELGKDGERIRLPEQLLQILGTSSFYCPDKKRAMAWKRNAFGGGESHENERLPKHF